MAVMFIKDQRMLQIYIQPWSKWLEQELNKVLQSPKIWSVPTILATSAFFPYEVSFFSRIKHSLHNIKLSVIVIVKVTLIDFNWFEVYECCS